MKHNHTKCKHTLSYCDTCDIVSCEKCPMEWGKKINSSTLSGVGLYPSGTTSGLVYCASDTDSATSGGHLLNHEH